MTPRETSAADAHIRAQRALVQRSLWLLEDSEAEWLATHLEVCGSCRAIEAEQRARAEDRAAASGHLPSRLVARWDTDSERLPEPVRAHVLAHLRSCEQCRNEFAMLGHALPAGVAMPARGVASPGPGFWARLRSKGPVPWVLGGGLATAAAALALYLAPILRGPVGSVATNTPPTQVAPPSVAPDSMTQQPPPETAPQAHPEPSPDRSGTPAEAAPLLALAGGGDAEGYEVVSLDEPTLRGAGDSGVVPERVVTAGVHRIGLRHPVAALLAAEDDDRVTIEITTPSGLVLHHVVPARDLRADRPLVLTLPEGIEAGTYRYAYSFGAHTRTPALLGEIQLRLH